jgi:hypothetical protein
MKSFATSIIIAIFALVDDSGGGSSWSSLRNDEKLLGGGVSIFASAATSGETLNQKSAFEGFTETPLGWNSVEKGAGDKKLVVGGSSPEAASAVNEDEAADGGGGGGEGPTLLSEHDPSEEIVEEKDIDEAPGREARSFSRLFSVSFTAPSE